MPQRLLSKFVLSPSFSNWSTTVTAKGSGILLLNQLPWGHALSKLLSWIFEEEEAKNIPRAFARITA